MAYKFEIQDEPDEDLDHVPHFKSRIDALVRDAKAIVTVGWRPTTYYKLFEYLLDKGKSVTLVEIFEPNCKAFMLEGVNVICDDIKNVYKNYNGVLLWQDGPEHMPMSDSKYILNDMKNYYDGIVIATPNGVYEQGPLYGNQWETHLASWYPEDYTDIGFEFAMYTADEPGSKIRTRSLIGMWTKNS